MKVVRRRNAVDALTCRQTVLGIEANHADGVVHVGADQQFSLGQLVRIARKTPLRDLFDKTKLQNDKERFGPNGPSLFDF